MHREEERQEGEGGTGFAAVFVISSLKVAGRGLHATCSRRLYRRERDEGGSGGEGRTCKCSQRFVTPNYFD